MLEELAVQPLHSNEIIMICVVSFIGANIREYLFYRSEERSNRFLRSPKMWISTIVSTIICYAIDPFVIEYSPRLVLLPPLVLGLAGADLAETLSTTKGIASLIEWGLGFVGISNAKAEDKKEEETDNNSKEQPPGNMIGMMVTPTVSFTQLKNLDDMVVSVLDSICNLLVGYYATKDKETFLKGYFIIMNNKTIMDNYIREFQVIHSTTALRLSEIVKKEIELNRVYETISAEVHK